MEREYADPEAALPVGATSSPASRALQPGSLPDPGTVDNLTELSRLFHAPVIPFLYPPIDI